MSQRLIAPMVLLAVLSTLVVAMPASRFVLAQTTAATSSKTETAASVAQQTKWAKAHHVISAGQADKVSDSTPAVYIIQLKDAPLVSYKGGVANIPATSPKVTGDRKLNDASQASRDYKSYLQRQHDNVVAAVRRITGAQTKVLYTYTAAFNGVALSLTPDQAAQVAKLPGVVRVERERMFAKQTDAGPGFIKAVQRDASPVVFHANLEGIQETPPITTTTATGAGSFLYNADTRVLSFTVAISGVTAIDAHIHRGARGVAGPIAYPIFAALVSPGLFQGAVTLSPADEALLYTNGLYVNIHSAAHTGGEIRGQIDAVQEATLFKATIAGAQETPPVTSAASGSATLTYAADTKTLSFRIEYSGLTPTLAHIHRGAKGVPGPVLIDLMPFMVGPGLIAGSTTLVTTTEALLDTDNLYINIHTAANPSGEIRGQIESNKGEGMIVGVIDSGINFAHPSFADIGGDGYDHTNPFGSGNYVGVCNPADPSFQATFKCNDKLIGAWTFAGITDPSPLNEPSPADDEGHGSHTASTAAGNVVASNVISITTGTVSGVAAHANIIAYDVCNEDGCPTTAIVAAINQAVIDGVDVINASLGSSASDPWGDADSLAYLSALDGGVLASISAGNDGPGAETIGSPADAPWVMSVGASTHDRRFLNHLVDFTGGDTTPPAPISGTGVSTGTLAAAPIVYAGAAPYNDALCDNDFAAGSLAGKIVVCDWNAVPGRVARATRVQAAGGIGFVLANTALDGTTLMVDQYPIPAVHIDVASATVLKTWLATGTGHTARITGMDKTPTFSAAYGDIIASFSSRGPNPSAPDVLKPDVAAPGVGILAAVANSDPNAAEFDFYGGTSMAAPHNAGAAALIRALHPNWSVAEVQSALMTTAIHNGVRQEDGTTPATPFDMGAGRIDVSRAAMAGLVLDETAQGFSDADPFFGGDPRIINRASMADSNCVAFCTWTRTLSNTLGSEVTWTASVTATDGVTLTIVPASFTIPAHGSQVISVTANVQDLPIGEYVFGRVALTAENNLAPEVTLPVAAQPATGDLPDLVDITTRNVSGSQELPNLTAIAISDLTIQTYGLVRGQQITTTLAADSDPDSPFDDLTDGIYIKSVDVLTDSARFVTEVITSTAPDLDMFVLLDGFDGSTPDGVPQESELVCVSATNTALESCDFTDIPPGKYFVLIQNWEGSAAPKDSFKLSTAVVPYADLGNMTVSGPTSVPAKDPFSLAVNWNLPLLQAGDRWYGAFDVGTQPSTAGNLGLVRVNLVNPATEFTTYLPIVRHQ